MSDAITRIAIARCMQKYNHPFKFVSFQYFPATKTFEYAITRSATTRGCVHERNPTITQALARAHNSGVTEMVWRSFH
jgi:hypothetical protein